MKAIRSLGYSLSTALLFCLVAKNQAFCPPVPTKSRILQKVSNECSLCHSRTAREIYSGLAASPLNDSDESSTSPLVKLATSPIGAIIVLLGVVLFHESGHYLSARAFGIHPQEFSIGFGPKLLGFQAFGDAFNLRALPLGGYVGFSPESLLSHPWQERVIISSAGVFFNALLTTGIYFGQVLYGQGIRQFIFEPGILVVAVAQKGAAASGILKPGDVIVGVNGKPIDTVRSSPTEAGVQRVISQVITTVQATPDGEAVALSIQRPKRPNAFDVSIVPKSTVVDEETGQPGPKTIGVLLEPNLVDVKYLTSDSPVEAASLALQNCAALTKETTIGLSTFVGDFFSRKESSDYKVSGPIGVIERASTVVATKDWNTVLQYAAAISVNFGVVNFLPIPPLDGFQVVYTLAQVALS